MMNSESAIGVYLMGQDRKKLPSVTPSPPGDEDFEKRETGHLGYKATGHQQVLKVAIFSPDRFVRDFLQGILTFQGYLCIDAHDGQDVFWNMALHSHQVVFLDGLYLLAEESEAVCHRAREFIQAGMNVMVLADRRWNAGFAQSWKVDGCMILWKPLDYRQIGQVMAQIGFGIGEV